MQKRSKHIKPYVIKISKKLDSLFCLYLGITKEKIRPHSLCMKNNCLLVTSALPYKRHIFKEGWNDFSISDLKKTNHPQIKEKIGLALGKSIAKGLVISFEEVEIDPPTYN